MKDEYCKKYFENKVKPKHLREFKTETPAGNVIEGYISRKPNKYLGSLVITHITEKDGKSYETEQFVQAFPKIHYWGGKYKLNDDEDISYYCQEKLDGTCLIIYSLNDNYGNSLEIIPKTRSQVVADEHILEMYKHVDKKAINEFFKDPIHLNDSLMFELFGILNKHEIAHMDTYIDINLIGAYIDGVFLDYISISSYSELESFKKPEVIFSIEKFQNENSFLIRWCGIYSRLRDYKRECKNLFPTLYDAIGEVKLMIGEINDEYYKNNNRYVIEGVVINGKDLDSNQMYLKIKPADIEENAKKLDFIPRRFILKEVRKYFDEFGSKIREIYGEDETHYVKYVKYHLKEEFDYEQIEDPRTRSRIKSVFMDVWNSKLPPESLQNICENLIKENPDASVSDLMKIFAKTYPSKKDKSRFVYNILTSIEKRNSL